MWTFFSHWLICSQTTRWLILELGGDILQSHIKIPPVRENRRQPETLSDDSLGTKTYVQLQSVLFKPGDAEERCVRTWAPCLLTSRHAEREMDLTPIGVDYTHLLCLQSALHNLKSSYASLFHFRSEVGGVGWGLQSNHWRYPHVTVHTQSARLYLGDGILIGWGFITALSTMGGKKWHLERIQKKCRPDRTSTNIWELLPETHAGDCAKQLQSVVDQQLVRTTSHRYWLSIMTAEINLPVITFQRRGLLGNQPAAAVCLCGRGRLLFWM